MNKIKILMLNAPYYPKFSRASRSPAISKGGTIYYPIWLAYATGFLEKEGFKVKLIDAPAKDYLMNEVIKIVKEFKPELTVIDTSTPSIYNDVKVLEEIKKEIKTFAVLVGTHVSALPKESIQLSEKIDAIAIHEYDYIIRDLATELSKEKPELSKVKGLIYRENKLIKENEKMPLIKNLDELPFVSEVYKKHLNIKDYFYAANLYPEITILTGRGCPYQCTFCNLPQVFTGRGYRFRSVKNVIKEFEFIKKEFPEVKEIFIEDDTFTANKQRVKEICNELIEKKIKIKWSCNSRADVDLETLKIMKKAGCRLLCVGFESGSQEILNNIKKGTTLKKIRQFMKDVKKAKILVHGCFLLGNQGETKETIKKTIDFAIELNPDTAQFFPLMVYPGTEAFKYFKEHNQLTTQNYEKWLTPTGTHNTIISRPGLTNKELVELCDEARKKFYLRPKYIFSKAMQALTNPKEMKRILKSGKTFYKYIIKKEK